MLYMQVEVGKRERLLASAELAGLKKYHFKEVHELQDQLLTQRAAVSKLTKQLQEAMQVVCAHATAQSLLLMQLLCHCCSCESTLSCCSQFHLH